MQTSQMTAADVLDRAAFEIERHGLFKGAYQSPTGQLCAVGAINLVSINGDAKTISERRKAKNAVRAYIMDDIPSWNDAYETTQNEVTSTLRAVATVLRMESTDVKVDAEHAEHMECV